VNAIKNGSRDRRRPGKLGFQRRLAREEMLEVVAAPPVVPAPDLREQPAVRRLAFLTDCLVTSRV